MDEGTSDQEQAVTGLDELRREWREGRISLDNLPAGTRRLALLAIALITVSCSFLVARALAVPLPGGTLEIPARFIARDEVASIPTLVVVVACLALGIAAAALALAVRRPSRRLGRVGLLGIAILGLALSSQLVGAARDLRAVEDSIRAQLDVPMISASSFMEVAGWLGIVGAVVALVLALSPSGRARTWPLAMAAATPFVLTSGTLGIVGYEAFDLGRGAAAAGLPSILNAQSFVAPAVLQIASIVGDFWLVPLGLWQVVAWARASRREVGLRVASSGQRWRGLLAALLTLKLGWLALGYAGRLPQTLGGGSPVWPISLADGAPAWLIALFFAALAGWWLAAPRALSVSERGFIPAAILVTVGFSFVTVALSLALAAFPVAALLPTTELRDSTLAAACQTSWSSEQIGNAARCAIDALTDSQLELTILSQLLTLVAALGLGVWLWRWPSRRSTALFLLATVVWVAPRIPDALGGLLHQPSALSIAPELVTFDTALTAIVAILAVLWYAGRQTGAAPGTLLLVLTVSTLLVHSGTLFPERVHSALFFLALLFPVAYELLLDSADLNRPHPERPARVLESLGIRVGVLSIVALSVTAGVINPGGSTWTDLGRVLFAVPFTALLVAATVSATRRRALELQPSSPHPEPGLDTVHSRLVPPRVLGAGVLAAALSLAVLVAGGGLADAAFGDVLAPAPTAAPTTIPTIPPSDAYRAFHSHITASYASASALISAASDHLNTGFGETRSDAASFGEFVANEGAWSRDHAPASCFAEAAAKWQRAIDELGRFGRLLGDLTETSSQAEADAVTAALRDYVARYDEFLAAHEAAAEACGAVAATPS